MRRRSGQKVVFMNHGEKARTLVHFLQKKLWTITNEEVYCWKYLNVVKSSHISVCGLVGWNYIMGTCCIIAKRSWDFSSTAFQLILTLVEISRILVSPWRHFVFSLTIKWLNTSGDSNFSDIDRPARCDWADLMPTGTWSFCLQRHTFLRTNWLGVCRFD